MVPFTATEVNINVPSVQDNSHLLFTVDVLVGLPWDLKHQHVACRLSTQDSFRARRGVWECRAVCKSRSRLILMSDLPHHCR